MDNYIRNVNGLMQDLGHFVSHYSIFHLHQFCLSELTIPHVEY